MVWKKQPHPNPKRTTKTHPKKTHKKNPQLEKSKKKKERIKLHGVAVLFNKGNQQLKDSGGLKSDLVKDSKKSRLLEKRTP